MPALSTFNMASVADGDSAISTANVTDLSVAIQDSNVWTEIQASAAFPARRGHSAVYFNGYFWVIGGFIQSGTLGDIWKSSDGINWTQVTPIGSVFPEREVFGLLVFNNKMWVLGGIRAPATFRYKDVWSSPDGVNWTQEADLLTETAAFGYTVFDGKMWVMGGSTNAGSSNVVWNSSDGITWNIVATAGWAGRYGHFATTYNNKLWIVGGPGFHDVWSSPDGITWTRTASNPGWVNEKDLSLMCVSGPYLCYVGGTNNNGDIWISSDGVTWTIVTFSSAITKRDNFAVVVNNGQLYIIAGDTNIGSWAVTRDVWSGVFDTYFDTVAKIGKVIVDYVHEDGRQVKKVVHDALTHQIPVSWSIFARDGAWQKNKVRVFNHEGASTIIPRSVIGSGEDLSHASGVMTLNT